MKAILSGISGMLVPFGLIMTFIGLLTSSEEILAIGFLSTALSVVIEVYLLRKEFQDNDD